MSSTSLGIGHNKKGLHEQMNNLNEKVNIKSVLGLIFIEIIERI